MIRTILTPDKNSIFIDVPDSYIGKRLEILFYATDELSEYEKPVKKPADYRDGLKLSEQQYKIFQRYVKDGRSEWQADI